MKYLDDRNQDGMSSVSHRVWNVFRNQNNRYQEIPTILKISIFAKAPKT